MLPQKGWKFRCLEILFTVFSVNFDWEKLEMQPRISNYLNFMNCIFTLNLTFEI